MGTRHLTCVVIDKQFKVAQYGQWDGYPSGAGKIIVDFIKTKMKPETFRKKLQALKETTDAEVGRRWMSVGADGSGMVTMDVVEKFKAKFPHLNRDCGAGILKLIQNGKAKEVQMQLDFAQDSLFCEWAYVVDMDKEVLEVYKGFNKKPVPKTNRFYSEKPLIKADGKPSEYNTIRLKKKYPFAELDNFLEQAKRWKN